MSRQTQLLDEKSASAVKSLSTAMRLLVSVRNNIDPAKNAEMMRSIARAGQDIEKSLEYLHDVADGLLAFRRLTGAMRDEEQAKVPA